MTDQSRVEAVARAIDPLAWDELEKLDEAIIPSGRLLSRIKASKQTANRAIEANDAWLKENGGITPMVKVKCTECPATGVRREDLIHSDYWMHCTVCGSKVMRVDQ